MQFDAIVIGGGFYGLSISLHLREKFQLHNVAVFESQPEVMTRASYVNQARVHNGYHYPRSLLTGIRSRALSPKFVSEFKKAIEDNFDHLYAIPRTGSKVTAKQFATFASRISAPIELARGQHRNLFNSTLVSEVFLVREPAFNAMTLRNLMIDKIQEVGGIHIFTNTKAVSVSRNGSSILRVITESGEHFESQNVFCALYAETNNFLRNSSLPQLELQQELTEIALFDPPSEFKNLAVTVMDGPFFSLMPFPAKHLHSLTHVRYTPRMRWRDGKVQIPSTLPELKKLKSGFPAMISDAKRYIPSLEAAFYDSSLWETKTVLKLSDHSDSRPIFYKQNHGIEGLTLTIGGKIDNIFDALSQIKIQ